MRLFGNAIQNYYGTLSITTPGGGLLAINSAGNVTVGSPASGTGLTVNPSPSGYFVLGLFASPTAAQVQSIATDTSDALGRAAVQFTTTTNGAGSDSQIDFITNKFGVSRASRLTIAPSGAVSIATPISAVTALTINAAANAVGMATNGTVSISGVSNTAFDNSLIIQPTFNSGASSRADSLINVPSTAAGSYTLPQIDIYQAQWGTKGAGSIITSLIGFHVDATLGGVATNAYGFQSAIAAGANQWNFYAAGTAANFFQGAVTVGAPPAATQALTVNGASNAYAGVFVGGSTAGQSFGLLTQAGTNGSDFALNVQNKAASSMLTVNGLGNVAIATPASGTTLVVNQASAGTGLRVNNSVDSASNFLSNGATKGIRFEHNTSGSTIDGVDNTGSGSFQPLLVQGTTLALFSATSNSGISIATTGAVSISAPTSGKALIVTGIGSSNSQALIAQATVGTAPANTDIGEIMNITNLSTAGDNRLLSFGQVGVNAFIRPVNQGAGPTSPGLFIATSSGGTTFGPSGNVSIAAPLSGTSLTIGGVAASNALVVNSANAAGSSTVDFVINRSGGTANNLAQGPSLQLLDTSGGVPSTILQQSAGQTELWQFNSSWQQILKVLTTRGVVINAPASGVSLAISPGNVNGTQTLTASGLTVSYGSLLLTSSTEVSSSNNLSIGTNAASVLGLYTNALLRATIDASGGLFMAGATGSGQGAGTINATGVFVNGVAVGASGLIKAVKTALTARPSTTTLSNDPDLVLAIPGAGTYVIEAFVSVYNTLAATVGASYNLNYSGTFTAASSIMGVATSATGPSGNALITGTVTTSLVAGNCGTTSPSPLLIKATLVATGAGNLGFAWAQNSSNATATNVGAGSYITATKIA